MQNIKLLLNFYLSVFFLVNLSPQIGTAQITNQSVVPRTFEIEEQEKNSSIDLLHGRIKIREDSELFFSPSNAPGALRISNSKDEVVETLKRLSTDDEIYGVGQIDPENKTVNFSTIERINVQRLLGLWWSDCGIVNFESYTRIVLYPDKDLELPENACPEMTKEKITFQYSIVPGNSSKEWVMFLSTCAHTYYSTIELNRTYSIVKIYGASTGKILRTLYLQRNLPK